MLSFPFSNFLLKNSFSFPFYLFFPFIPSSLLFNFSLFRTSRFTLYWCLSLYFPVLFPSLFFFLLSFWASFSFLYLSFLIFSFFLLFFFVFPLFFLLLFCFSLFFWFRFSFFVFLFWDFMDFNFEFPLHSPRAHGNIKHTVYPDHEAFNKLHCALR